LGLSGTEPIIDRTSGLATTVAWKLNDENCRYAFEGGIYNAASAVNWARGLGLFKDYAEIDAIPGQSAISRRLAFVPALSGLACPQWDRRAAGLWIGLGLETTKADMMQALLEGVALLGCQVLEAMSRHSPAEGPLSIDGGMTRNRYFLQFMANALNRRLVVPASEELTGLGTAQMALIGVGLAKTETLPPTPPARAIVEPAQPLSSEDKRVFSEAVRRCGEWR
jgi:glycerol kinase